MAAPRRLADFGGRRVLEMGCGDGGDLVMFSWLL